MNTREERIRRRHGEIVLIVRVMSAVGYRRHVVDVEPGPVGADIVADVMRLLHVTFPTMRIRYVLYGLHRCLELEW